MLCSFSAQKTEAQSIGLFTVLTQKDKILLLKPPNCQKLWKMGLKIEILKASVPLFLQKKFSRLIKDKVFQIDQTTTGTNQGLICEKRPTLMYCYVLYVYAGN